MRCFFKSFYCFVEKQLIVVVFIQYSTLTLEWKGRLITRTSILFAPSSFFRRLGV